MDHRHKTFALPIHDSPTYCNLSHYLKKAGWQEAPHAELNTTHFDFNERITQTLEYKHQLAGLIQQYCPHLMPLTYCLDEDNWQAIVDIVKNNYPHLTWILKPSLLNNGQKISIFSNPQAIVAYYKQLNRLGGPHVLQQYITTPHLLRDKRKYSIRQLVVLTHYSGAYLYQEGYFNVALHPYTPDYFANSSAHLTNEYLIPGTPNTLQIPATQFAHYEFLLGQITPLLKDLFQGVAQKFSNELAHCLPQIALLGFDFIVEETGRVWLLEANHGPCFPTDSTHPLYYRVYEPFWQELISSFIEPLSQKEYGVVSSNAFVAL